MAEPNVPIVEYGAPVAPDTPVRMVQAGQRIAVPAAQAQQYIDEGWDLESHAETVEQELRREAGSLGNTALTALEGTASGVTLGLSDLALDAALGDAYTQNRQRRADVNDNTALVSQLLGAAAPAVLTAGSSSAATAGSLAARAATVARYTPAGALARAANFAGRGVEGALAREGAGFARTMSARALGTAVEGGIEGAIQQAAHNTVEASLGDEQLTAERLLAGIPQAGLFGAGFGALFGAGLSIPAATRAGLQARTVNRALPADQFAALRGRATGEGAEVATTRLGEHVAPELAEAGEDGFVNRARETAINWSSKLSGKSADDIRLAWTNRKASDDAFRYSELLDESVEKAATAVDGLIAADPVSRAVARGELKSANVATNIKRGADVQEGIRQDVAKLRSEFMQQVADDAFEGPARPGKGTAPNSKAFDKARSEFGTAFGKKTKDALKVFDQAMAAAEKSGDFEANAYIALEELKRAGDAIGPQARRSAQAASSVGNQLGADQALKAFEFWENLSGAVRTQLEDVGRYGKAGANQKARNAAITEFMATKQAFDSRFVKNPQEQLGKEAGDFQHWSDRKLISNRSGIRGHLDNLLDNDTAYERNQVLRHLEARAKAIATLEEIGELPAKYREEFMAAKKGAEEFRALLGEQTERLRNAQAVKRLQDSDAGTGLLNDATKMASGTLIGTLLGGPIGAVVGAATDVLRNPYGTAHKIAGVHLLKDRLAKQDVAARRAIRKLVTPGKPREVGRKIGTALTVGTAVYASTKDRRKRAERIERDVKAWQQNPMLLTKHVTDHVTRGLGGAAPVVVTRIAEQQARLLQNLANRIPHRAVGGTPLNPELMPAHDDDVRRFLAYAAGALNPASVLEDGKAVTLAPEALDAIKENWPAYWEHTRKLVMSEVASSTKTGDMSYSERLTLSLLFDLPGDAALDPGFLQRQHARYESRKQQSQAQPPPPAQREAADTSKGAMLLSDSISQRI